MTLKHFVASVVLTIVGVSASCIVSAQTKPATKSESNAQPQLKTQAQPQSDSKIDSKPDFEFIATVNGVPITQGLFNLNLQAALAQGQKDTPQLRESIKSELINRQLIAQEVVKQGLDKEVDLQDQITQLRQNLYLQVLIEDHLKKNPITNEKLKEEYEKQKQSLGGTANSS